ncbi:MAG: F0F1 ATP synthase subunit B [Oscillospiraceae bacterium]|nr:F0F1 ATP synthase subunit B [Oscillospiraceae bacterium]
MDLHPVDIIISLINIVVLFILLRLILWKHVIRFLAEREGRVKGEMDDAEKRRLEAEALHGEYNKKIENIEERGRDMMRESKAKANEESEKILKETRDKARIIISDAEARIAEEKEQALEESQVEVTQLATEMASRILEREVSLEDNAHIVDSFFGKK